MDFSVAHLHLMFNHIPVLGAPFLALLLLIGLIRRSAELQRVALGLTVLLALVTIPIYLTGDPAQEQVENQPWFDKDRGHDHEERADAALVGMLVAGAVALGGLWLRRKTPDVRRPLAGLALAALLVASGLLAWTALGGGQIRHDEVRGAAGATGGGTEGRAQERED